MSDEYSEIDNPDMPDAARPRRDRGPSLDEINTEILATSGDKKQGSNRRKMAWIALISMLVVTILLLFVVDPTRIEILSEPIVWFYMAMASVVGAYMGFTTYAYIRRNG